MRIFQIVFLQIVLIQNFVKVTLANRTQIVLVGVLFMHHGYVSILRFSALSIVEHTSFDTNDHVETVDRFLCGD